MSYTIPGFEILSTSRVSIKLNAHEFVAVDSNLHSAKLFPTKKAADETIDRISTDSQCKKLIASDDPDKKVLYAVEVRFRV